MPREQSQQITPPDMVGLTGDQEQDTSGLLDSLRSRGTLPLELMMLLQQQARPAPQANPFAVALAGGVAAMRGQPNPVLEQQAYLQQGQGQGMTGALALLRIMEQDRRADEELRLKIQQQKAREAKEARDRRDVLINDLIASPDAGARMFGWMQRRRDAKASGVDIPDDVIQSLGAGDLDPKKMTEIISMMREMRGQPDAPEIVGKYFKLSPSQVAFMKTIANSPKYQEELAIKQEDLDRTREDHAIKVQGALNAERRLTLQEQRETRMEEEARLRGARAERTEQRAIAASERAERAQERADRHQRIWEQELNRKFETKDDKQKATREVMTDWVDQFLSTGKAIDDKHYLPKTAAGIMAGPFSGDWSAARAAKNRALYPKDSDWVMFTKILQGGGVGFERSILNDIGPRALAAYKGIISFFDDPPTYEAMKKAGEFMKREIEIAKTGKRPALQDVVYESGGKTLRIKQYRQGDPLPPDAKVLWVDGEPVPNLKVP